MVRVRIEVVDSEGGGDDGTEGGEMEWQRGDKGAAATAGGGQGAAEEEGGVWWASTATISGVAGCSGA